MKKKKDKPTPKVELKDIIHAINMLGSNARESYITHKEFLKRKHKRKIATNSRKHNYKRAKLGLAH